MPEGSIGFAGTAVVAGVFGHLAVREDVDEGGLGSGFLAAKPHERMDEAHHFRHHVGARIHTAVEELPLEGGTVVEQDPAPTAGLVQLGPGAVADNQVVPVNRSQTHLRDEIVQVLVRPMFGFLLVAILLDRRLLLRALHCAVPPVGHSSAGNVEQPAPVVWTGG